MMPGMTIKEARSLTKAACVITQTEESQLQKEVNELKKQLKKILTIDKEADSTSPTENNQGAAKLLQEVIATKQLIQQDLTKIAEIKAKNEQPLKFIKEER